MFIKILPLLTIFLVISTGPFVYGDVFVGLGDKCNAENADVCQKNSTTAQCIGGVCCQLNLQSTDGLAHGLTQQKQTCFSDNQCCYNKQFPKIFKCIKENNQIVGHCTQCRNSHGKCLGDNCICCGQKDSASKNEYSEKLKKGAPCNVNKNPDEYCKSKKCDENGSCM